MRHASQQKRHLSLAYTHTCARDQTLSRIMPTGTHSGRLCCLNVERGSGESARWCSAVLSCGYLLTTWTGNVNNPRGKSTANRLKGQQNLPTPPHTRTRAHHKHAEFAYRDSFVRATKRNRGASRSHEDLSV